MTQQERDEQLTKFLSLPGLGLTEDELAAIRYEIGGTTGNQLKVMKAVAYQYQAREEKDLPALVWMIQQFRDIKNP